MKIYRSKHQYCPCTHRRDLANPDLQPGCHGLPFLDRAHLLQCQLLQLKVTCYFLPLKNNVGESEVTALPIEPVERLLLGKADFLHVHGVVLKRLWITNPLTQQRSTYRAEGSRAIPWNIREYKTEKWAHNLQRGQGWDFKGNGPQIFLNLAAEVRDPHFTAVP